MSAIPGQRGWTKIEGPFVPRSLDLLQSPAFRALSLSAHRALIRLEIEVMRNGGAPKANAHLVVTFDQFAMHGMDRHAIAPAIRELCALGLVEITQRGTAGNAQFRRPAKYRLTYLATKFGAPTNEWRRIATAAEAEQKARIARAANDRGEKQKPVAVLPTKTGGEKLHRKRLLSGGENPPHSPRRETPTSFNISVSGDAPVGTVSQDEPSPSIIRRRLSGG